MESKELRVGNIVCPINRSTEIHMPNPMFPLKVVTIGAFDVQATSFKDRAEALPEWKKYKLFDIAGVPLNGEWLQKAGFSEGCVISENIGKTISHKEKDFSLLKVGDDYFYTYDEYNIASVGFRYVHQLQNLFQSLTGEELTFAE